MVIDQATDWLVVYIDDIIIGGNSREEVWSRSKIVLERLIAAGFMVNLKKSTFMVRRVK